MSSFFLGGTAGALGNALDGLALRHRTLSHNIANAETPNYKRSDVSFEGQLLKRAAGDDLKLAVTSELHIDPVADADRFSPRTWTDHTTSMRRDNNNVDIEAEMTRLLQNELSYTATAQLMQKKLAGMAAAIDGR